MVPTAAVASARTGEDEEGVGDGVIELRHVVRHDVVVFAPVDRRGWGAKGPTPKRHIHEM